MTAFVTVLLLLALIVGVLAGLVLGWWAALRTVPDVQDHGPALAEVSGVRQEIERMTGLVHGLHVDRAQQDGHITARLEQAAHATAALATTAGSLRDALASNKARGQWGERMAEDVLRTAGLVRGVNYVTQTAIEGGGIPDITFLLPGRRSVHMDVKFPASAYLRFLESGSEADARQFMADVRIRVSEVTKRGYVDPESTLPFVLLFIPNESIYGFIHEQDSDLMDWAMEKRVVLCSPSTLFAMLAVIRQAADQYTVEMRSRQILDSLRGLRHEWAKFSREVDKMGRGLASATTAYEAFSGPRTRAFEKKLDSVDAIPVVLAKNVDPSEPEPSYPHAV